MKGNSINYTIDEKINNIPQVNALAVGKIKNVDMEHLKADVDFLHMNEDDKYNSIEGVPISTGTLGKDSGISVIFEEGDKVLVGILRHNFSSLIDKEYPETPAPDMNLNMANAVILAKIMPSEFKNDKFKNGLLIYNKKQEILLAEDGVFIKADNVSVETENITAKAKTASIEAENILTKGNINVEGEHISVKGAVSVEAPNFYVKGGVNIDGGINSTADGNIGGYSIKGLADKMNEIIQAMAQSGGQ